MEANIPSFPRMGSKRKLNAENIQTDTPVIKKKKLKPRSDDTEFKPIECLTSSNISEGMLILGCITHITDGNLKISLPGCLEGTVPIMNISSPYNELLNHASECPSSAESVPALNSIFHLGESFPCKVLSVNKQPGVAKTRITLSVNPVDVNSDIRPASLYYDMVLHAAVKSIEDHGYVMDLGIPGIQGFIKHSDSSILSESKCELKIGQVIPTLVKLSESSECKIIPLVSLPKQSTVPKIKESVKISLNSLLPGMYINAVVQQVCKQGLVLNCMGFDACAWKEHFPLDISPEKIASTEVTGTVLYVHPITRLIYLTLNKRPTAEMFMKVFSSWKKWDLIEKAVVIRTEKNSIYFDLGNSIKGQALKRELSDADVTKITSEYDVNTIHRCRVLSVHPMDNIIRVTLKQSALNIRIVKPEELFVGAIFTGKIHKFVKGGMLVKLSPNIQGFVRNVQMADGPFKSPETLFKVGNEVHCRVLSVDLTTTPYSLFLTCKKTLCDPNLPILSSYADAYPGFVTKGVIVNISSNYILLSFFNNVQGIVPHSHFESNSNMEEIYFKGQVVKCRVTHCKPEKKILHLSLKITTSKISYEGSNLAAHGLGVGFVTDVFVKSKTESGLCVQFANSSITAFLPYGHLTDIEDHIKVLGRSYVENDVLKVLVFRSLTDVIVTKKNSFVRAAENKLLPQQLSDLKVGDIVLVVIREFNSDGMVVELGNNICGHVPKQLMIDGTFENMSNCGFTVDQTLMAKVVCVDYNLDELQLSTRMSDVYNKNPAHSLDVLQSFLEDRAKLRAFYATSEGPTKCLASFSIGTVVLAKITSIGAESIFCELENGVKGMASRINCGEGLEEEKSFRAVVIFVDFQNQVVEVSFSPHTVKCAMNMMRSDAKSSEVKPGQIIKSNAVFISKECIIVELGGHAVGSLAYLPSRKIFNDAVGRHKLYSLGQRYRIVIKRICDEEILCVLEKHQHIYERSMLVSKRDNLPAKSQEEVTESENLPSTSNADIQPVAVVPSCSVQADTEEVLYSYTVGETSTATISSVKKFQLNIITKANLQGRVHITNVGCTSEGEFPLKTFLRGSEINVKILGFNKRKSSNFLLISHQSYDIYAECSLCGVPSVTTSMPLSLGQDVLGFVKEVGDVSVYIWLGPQQVAELPFLHASSSMKELRTIKKRYKVGQSVKCRVYSIQEDNVILTKLGKWEPREGHRVTGLVQVCSLDKGFTVKLPHGYSGEIAITDVSDNYNATENVMSRFLEQRFVQCCILEVVSWSKTCILSTRSSRLYGKNNVIDREISPVDIDRGQCFRGFVKLMSPISIHVNLGRKFEGIVKVGGFSEEVRERLKAKYPVGSIMEVKVRSIDPQMILCQIISQHSELGTTLVPTLPFSRGFNWMEEKARHRLSPLQLSLSSALPPPPSSPSSSSSSSSPRPSSSSSSPLPSSSG